MMEKEIWKDIKGYEGIYQVSNYGKVKSLERIIMRSNGHPKPVRERILRQHFGNIEYLMVSLCKNKSVKKYCVHRLILEAFILNPENKRCCNHKNGIKSDNRIINLEWVTYSENMKHSFKMGLHKYNGVVNPRYKKVKCINNGKIYRGIKYLITELGITRKQFNYRMKLKNKIKGLMFEFID